MLQTRVVEKIKNTHILCSVIYFKKCAVYEIWKNIIRCMRTARWIPKATNILTPWSRVLLEKLTGFAANQGIPRILWNPTVHYVLTSARHLSLSLANPIQSPQPFPTSSRSILATNIHSQYLLLTVFTLQQGLHERASLLRYSHTDTFNFLQSGIRDKDTNFFCVTDNSRPLVMKPCIN